MCHLLFIYLRRSEKEEVNTHRENQAIHFPISDHEPNPFYRRLSSVSCKGSAHSSHEKRANTTHALYQGFS